MRQPCPCGSTIGRIAPRGFQDCVYCQCGRYRYNAPRIETGKEVRTVETREPISPKRRYRILEAFGHRCVGCGNQDDGLTLDHLVSRSDAARLGFLDEIIDSDDNLAPMCPACNAGKGRSTASVQLAYRCLVIRRNAAGVV